METKFEVLIDNAADRIVYIEYDTKEKSKMIGFNYMQGISYEDMEIFKRDSMKVDKDLLEIYKIVKRMNTLEIPVKDLVTYTIEFSISLEMIGYRKVIDESEF